MFAHIALKKIVLNDNRDTQVRFEIVSNFSSHVFHRKMKPPPKPQLNENDPKPFTYLKKYEKEFGPNASETSSEI